MKKYFLLLLILNFQLNSIAQDTNIFSRYSSMPEINEDRRKKIELIPDYHPKQQIKDLKSVEFIDNSTLQFFPAIFNQIGNSCSQASGIRYIFSYEINRLRNVNASDSKNVYSYHYTWNFLNEGSNLGTWYYDGYDLVKDNGAPNIIDFPDNSATEKTWMSGYSKYYNAMHNRIESYSKLDAEASGSLDLMKQYLIDHGDGSETGGLINFSGKTENWDIINYSGPSNTGYKYAIRNFGNGGDHAMTIVGFDDDIKVDVNSDGTIQDDEIGAFIIVNSWGSNWCSNGRAYMPYKLLYKSWWNGGMGNGDHYVYMMEVKSHEPTVTAKVNITYTSRNDLWMIIGVADDPNATYTDKTKTMKIFKKLGGDFYMQGGTSNADKQIEIGLDYSELIEKIPDAKKIFLKVKQSPEGELGEGVITSFSILDYRQNQSFPIKYTCTQTNVTIDASIELSVSSVSTRVEQYSSNSNINIYPNPVNKGGELYISNLQEIKQVKLINQHGQVITSKNMNSGQTNFVIPSNINTGIYILELVKENNIFFKKIVIN